MKRIFPFFVAVVFAVMLMCLSSCADTNVLRETTDTMETTDTVDTTDTTETTAPQDTAWKPDPSMRWLYVPACPYDEEGHADDEIKLTLEESVFAEAPDELRVTIRKNKVAEDPYDDYILLCLNPYYEKVYDSYDIGYGIFMGWPYSMWARLPISVGDGAYLLETWSPTQGENLEFTWTFPFASAKKDENLELTPGHYRLVIFAGDGPHYAEFRITG